MMKIFWEKRKHKKLKKIYLDFIQMFECIVRCCFGAPLLVQYEDFFIYLKEKLFSVSEVFVESNFSNFNETETKGSVISDSTKSPSKCSMTKHWKLCHSHIRTWCTWLNNYFDSNCWIWYFLPCNLMKMELQWTIYPQGFNWLLSCLLIF